MTRFGKPGWALRFPFFSHRTLAEVRRTEHLRRVLAVPGYAETLGGKIDVQHLVELEARAVDPEWGGGGDAA